MKFSFRKQPPSPDVEAVRQAHDEVAKERARAAGVWARDPHGEMIAYQRWPGAHWRTWRVNQAAGPDNGIVTIRVIRQGHHHDVTDDRRDLDQAIANIRALPQTDPLGMDQR